jgi:hypothetical protein
MATFVIGGFNLELQQNIVALRPIRGEMFIADGPFFDPALRRGATAFTCIGNLPLARNHKHLAPLRAKTNFAVALVS